MIPSVLVTGGLGYLGGRLLAHLREAGFGALRATSRRARRPAWFQDLDLVQTGMDDFGGLVGACTGVDAVVHLAALNAQACGADPALARAVNVGGTERLLRAAHAAGVERVVYLSTAHVYGAPLAGRLDEHSPTVSGNPGAQPPAHPYATTHRAAEDAVRDWAGRTGGTAVVLRLSNAVGAPMDAGADCWMLLVNDLCRQAVTTGRLALRGPGLDRRDYLPLADAVAAVAHLLAADRNVLGDGLFNVGSGESRETIAVARLVAERCRAVLGFLPPIDRPEPAPDATAPDLDYRIDRLIAAGFTPAARLEDEIDATLRLCRNAFGS